jgi:hypothetical protein
VNQIKIGVRVPLAAALAAGRAQYGYDSVTLTDADVASLSLDARGLLRAWEYSASGCREDNDRRCGLVGVSRGQWTEEVEVTQADAPTVLGAIEAIAERVRVKAAREREESEAQIAKALAHPDDQWIARSGPSDTAYYIDATTREYSRDATGVQQCAPRANIPYYLSSEQKCDPRVVARLQHVETNVLPGLRAEHDRRRAEWISVRDAARIEREARTAAWQTACVQYVIRWVPEYAQAARDGCDVGGLARSTSVDTFTEMLHSHSLETVEAYGKVEAHPRPHQRAYEALETVRGLIGRAPDEDIAAASAGLVDEFSTRIVRADTCEEDDCSAGKRTCIEITLRYFDGNTQSVYVYADGALPHVHESDDDA